MTKKIKRTTKLPVPCIYVHVIREIVKKFAENPISINRRSTYSWSFIVSTCNFQVQIQAGHDNNKAIAAAIQREV